MNRSSPSRFSSLNMKLASEPNKDTLPNASTGRHTADWIPQKLPSWPRHASQFPLEQLSCHPATTQLTQRPVVVSVVAVAVGQFEVRRAAIIVVQLN